MNKNQIKGRIRAAKGKGKEVLGIAVRNKELKREGRIEKLSGKAAAAYGDLQKEIQRRPT